MHSELITYLFAITVLKVPGHSKWSLHKIPRLVPSQIRYITDQVTRSQR